MKLPHLLVGIIVILASLAMASAVDAGFTAEWPDLFRGIWAFTLIAGMIVGVLLGVYGLGLLNHDALNVGAEPGGRELSPLHFGAVYAGSLVLMVGLALVLETRFGIPGERAILIGGGAIFLVASTGRPWWLLRTFRNLGWFAILGDRAIRVTLLVLGLAILSGGLLGF